MTGREPSVTGTHCKGTCLVLLAGLCAFVSGCTSGNPDPERFQRDGVQYGVLGKTFRARWWNYYECGRSLNDGQFWEAAEADCRKAIAVRGRDQLWARTYGLHFIDYFNRTFAKPFRWTYTGRPVTAETVKRPATWKENWATCREDSETFALVA